LVFQENGPATDQQDSDWKSAGQIEEYSARCSIGTESYRRAQVEETEAEVEDVDEQDRFNGDREGRVNATEAEWRY
jgi:hypothetical protein